MNRLFLFGFFFFSWTCLWAQTEKCDFTLSGQVIDEHDQTPLPYATVYIKETGHGIVADSNGFYVLPKLCIGKLNLVVNHVSCKPVTLMVTIKGNARQNLYLEHHLEDLQEITIAGVHIESQTNSAQEQQLQLSTLERYGQVSLGDALKEVIGVSSLSTGKTIVKPVIQGLSGSRVLVVNQGVRMQDMEWGDEHAPNVDINTADRVTVVKGASALRYGGDALGGAVIIEPTVPIADTLWGKTLIQGASNGRGGSISSEVMKSGKKGWFGKVQASLKRYGDFDAPDYVLSNTGMFQKGISLYTGRAKDQKGFDLTYSFYGADIAIMRASHIGNIIDLVNALNSQEPTIVNDFSYHLDFPRQEVTHHMARLQYYTKLKGNSRWQAQYDVQQNHRLEFDIRVGDDKNKPALDLELTSHTMSSQLEFNQQGALPLETGLMYRYQNNFADPGTGVRRLIPDYQKYDLGAFMTGSYSLSHSFAADAGIRYDFTRVDALKFYQISRWTLNNYQDDFGDLIVEELATQLLVNPRFDYHNISATLGFQHHWHQGPAIRLNYAFAQRAPNPSELFSDGLHQSAARIELGDLRIDQETSHKLSLSLNGRQEIWSWEVLPFYNIINDFILLEPKGVEQTIRGAFPVWGYRQVDAMLWGIDARTAFSWSRQWTSNHRISYIRGQDTRSQRPLINMPAPQVRQSITFKQPEWKELQILLESVYTLEQQHYPLNNFLAYLAVTDEFQEVDVSTPPPAYHLLNASVSTRLTLLKDQDLELALAIDNLLNNRYRDYLNRLRFFGDETGRSFRFSLKFNY